MFPDIDVHSYRKLTLFWLLALIVVAPAAAQVGLGLAPMRLEFRLAAGQQTSGTLDLSNNSGGKIRIRTELLDFFVDTTATPQFERNVAAEAGDSCRAWLSVNPMETEAAASAQLPVRYTIRVPAGTKDGSYHCAAGFVTLPAAEQAKASGIRTAVRVVTAFYVVVGDPPLQGEVKRIQLEQLPSRAPDGPAWQAVVVIENRGRMHMRPSGTLTVLDSEDHAVETADFQSLPVLPEREQRFLFPLKTDVHNGGYKLRARVDLGTGEIQEASATLAPMKP
jgi:hypothetical protein